MKRLLVLAVFVVAFVAALAVSVQAEEAVCIIAEERNPRTGKTTYEEVCWLIGSDGTYTVTATQPPVLYPQLGSNADGTECWYWTTTVTRWVILVERRQHCHDW